MSKLIAQGAEAKILLDKNHIIKDRIKKSYRLSEIDDKIRKQRTKAETKLLIKASKIINVPILVVNNKKLSDKNPMNKEGVNHNNNNNNLGVGSRENGGGDNNTQIIMPFINGKKLSENLDKLKLSKQLSIMNQIGKDIAKLHDSDIIHGDLTTSNMILVENFGKSKADNQNTSGKIRIINKNKSVSKANPTFGWGGGDNTPVIFFIDFGLGFISNKFEDKAVDLHLLKQALEARHYTNWQTLWKEVEAGYKSSKTSKQILERLKAVEKRGRYKGG